MTQRKFLFIEHEGVWSVVDALLTIYNMMIHPQEEILALLANDLFHKRQRLLQASQVNLDLADAASAEAFEVEYATAEGEYAEAKAAFARAMNEVKRIR
ncbi:MAG: hypothetical protein V4632_19690 [Pseudomonadota bacterium]